MTCMPEKVRQPDAPGMPVLHHKEHQSSIKVRKVLVVLIKMHDNHDYKRDEEP